jgi:IS5 family transposase
MINDFEDFCLYVYVIVDDMWQQIAPLLKKRGPEPLCSDSELVTMVLVGECRGWELETDLLSYWGEHRDLFPVIPSQSRFNRRRRNLMQAINMLRKMVLQMLDISQDRQCAIDSLPVPVVQFHLVPGSTGDWSVHGATFGKVASKKLTIFGYKLHLLVTLGGLILDFVLAPANEADLTVGVELLEAHTDMTVYGDKGYISALIAATLLHTHRLRLVTLPRANQKMQLPGFVRKTINAVRQIIETVNGQLTEQFHLEHNHAHTFWGLCTRLHSKLTAHTLCVFINRLLGVPDFLQIKRLAFPHSNI